MAVKRIVANIGADDLEAAKAFYSGILGLETVMDFGWIVTFAADTLAVPQVSVAREGGSGAPVPDLSVEVDDLEPILRRLRKHGIPLEYGPVAEPWGVERCFVRDPAGRLINILTHR